LLARNELEEYGLGRCQLRVQDDWNGFRLTRKCGEGISSAAKDEFTRRGFEL
jgi:hypothetical protein